MSTSADRTTTIANAIETPQVVTFDGQTTQQRAISDQIAADNHVAGKQALKRRSLGLIFRKRVPGSANG